MVQIMEKAVSRTKSKAADEMRLWDAVQKRDRSRDGDFVYSVATTGIFCRPSCPSRLPNRENVRFFPNPDEAEAAGFRACKRCHPRENAPHDVNAEKVAKACRLIEGAEEEPKLESIAAAVGLSPYHFHRVFKHIVGITPKAYAVAQRQKRIRTNLSRRTTVTEAIHESGFNSSGRFYADSSNVLGMTPTAFKSGGGNFEMRFAVGETSLGSILVAATDKGIAAILLGDDAEKLVHELEDSFPNAKLVGGDRQFEKTMSEVIGLIEAPTTALNMPLDIRGTSFQHRVWQALRDVPPGETVTYAEIAKRIGKPKAVRAVASACAANKLAVAIPCHRVIRHDGSLSGYRWGVERKQALIDRESHS
jgi:AraC family transcriptional regulator of adaptative response/methylated-DNA-[protein]-cysteine methyltransferase